jgi:hypothetical protein
MRFALILAAAIVLAMATLPHAKPAICFSCSTEPCVDSSDCPVRGCYCAKDPSEPSGTCEAGN